MSTEVLDPESRRQRMKEIQEEMAQLKLDEIAENNAVDIYGGTKYTSNLHFGV